MGKEQHLLQAVKDQDVGSVEKILMKYCSSKKIVGSTKRLNINQQDADGMSVLHHASLLGNVEIMKMVLDVGAQVDLKDAKGMRALQYAAWQGQTKPTEMLLGQGSSVDNPAFDGNSPLHLACEHGHFDVVTTLLERGADVCVANSQHRTPLDLACEFGRTSVVEKLLEIELCRALLKDTSADTADNSRTTCLHLAARNGHIDTIRMLLEAGIDINRTTLQGTCLHEAAKYGKRDVVRLLLSCGIDVARLNSYEQTALELVNKFTMSRAAQELKQMLKEASSEIRVQPIPDYSTSSGCPNPNVFRNGGFQAATQSSAASAGGGVFKSHRNGLDGHSTGHTVLFPPNISRAVDPIPHKNRHGKSSHWNHSLPQPSPIEVTHFVGSVGIDESVPSPRSPFGKGKVSSHELAANCGLLSHLIANRSTGHQMGNTGDRQSPVLLTSSPSVWNGSHLGTSDDGHGKVGSTGNNRMSGGSNGSGSYHSGSSQQSSDCQNRLSGQSYESGVSGISSSQQSCHSSSSSQGSLDQMEESGYSSTVNVHELLQQGLSDTDILCTWLSSLHLEELTSLFVNAGYDMPTVTRMTPEDLTAIGITKPSMRKKLKSEISKLSISDGIPDYRPKDLSDWLNSLHLDEYRDTLIKQGFGTLDTVTEITWEDLEEIGIKRLGHQKKMMLAIDRLKRINAILHRLSGSSHSSNEGLNHIDPSISSGKLLSRIPSSMSSTATSPSFISASSRRHAVHCENSTSRKTGARENCGILNERQIITVERFGSKGQSTSIEIHPMPLNKLSPNFPVSNMTSVDHNTYPALIESSSRNDLENQVPTGVSTDSVENGGGLDGDATPTNERKWLGNVDHNNCSAEGFLRTTYSKEEPMDFYKADHLNMKPGALSSYSTLPKKLCGKRKVTDVNDFSGAGFSGFLNFENLLSSKKSNCDPSQSLSVEKASVQHILNRQKRDPPPPPKRSDSFKSTFLAVSVGNRDRDRTPSQKSSIPSGISANSPSRISEDISNGHTNDHAHAENNAITNGRMLPYSVGNSMMTSSCCENANPIEFQRDAQQQQQKKQTTNKTFDESANVQGADWQDGRMSEGSDDSDSGLESRHSASSASLESSGSGGGIESNTLPFANENVGTIKQRNPSSKPSILTSLNGDRSELNKSLFENENNSPKCKIHTNGEQVDNAKTQSSQFTLINGEIINEAVINNGNLLCGVNSDDVFDDIDGMLNGLTQELDEMLKFHE